MCCLVCVSSTSPDATDEWHVAASASPLTAFDRPFAFGLTPREPRLSRRCSFWGGGRSSTVPNTSLRPSLSFLEEAKKACSMHFVPLPQKRDPSSKVPSAWKADAWPRQRHPADGGPRIARLESRVHKRPSLSVPLRRRRSSCSYDVRAPAQSRLELTSTDTSRLAAGGNSWALTGLTSPAGVLDCCPPPKAALHRCIPNLDPELRNIRPLHRTNQRHQPHPKRSDIAVASVPLSGPPHAIRPARRSSSLFSTWGNVKIEG